MSTTTRIPGIAVIVVGGSLALGGAALTGVHASERDRDGYYTESIRLHSSGSAATSDRLDINGLGNDLTRELAGTVRVRLGSDGSGPPVVGIAPRGDAAPPPDGPPPPGPPAAQSFWKTSSTGNGSQTLRFKPRNGHWRIVAMNPGGTAGVE